MDVHANAKLGPAGRLALVRSIESGRTLKQAAACCVAPATAHKWWHRWLAATPSERQDLSCLKDRSSRPHRSPCILAAADQERICDVRRHTGWGPRLIAGVVGRPHSTVHRALLRHGLSRPPRRAREQVVRYEWPCPGDLLHMDQALRALPAPRTCADRRSRRSQPRRRLSVGAFGRRRPLAAGLLGAALRRARPHRGRLRPAGAWVL